MYCCTCAVNATVLHLFVTKYAWHQQTGIALSTISPALPPPPLRSLPLSLRPLLNCDKLSTNNFKKLYPILCNIYSRLPSVENRSSSSPSFRCLWNVVSCGYRSIIIYGSSRWRTELISYGKWIVIYKRGLHIDESLRRRSGLQIESTMAECRLFVFFPFFLFPVLSFGLLSVNSMQVHSVLTWWSASFGYAPNKKNKSIHKRNPRPIALSENFALIRIRKLKHECQSNKRQVCVCLTVLSYQ